MADLRKTPLNAVHRESGARMVDFGGWDMPVEYSGVIAEHNAVRTAAGLFDVSHMGQFEVEGEGALAFLQRVTCNNVAKLVDGQAQYSALPMPNGAPVDDVIVYRHGDGRSQEVWVCETEETEYRHSEWVVFMGASERLADGQRLASKFHEHLLLREVAALLERMDVDG